MAVEAHMYRENLGLPFAGGLDMSNDGFCFDLKHSQQQQLQLPLQFQQQQQSFVHQQVEDKPQFQNNFVFSAIKPRPSTVTQTSNNNVAFSQSITTHADKQRREVDGYIHQQNERLKLVLKEQRKQQLAAILRKLEARTAIVMRQKDEEIAQAAKRRMELEEFMKRLEMENQAWKRIAGENESMIANLNSAIVQLREKASLSLQEQQQPSNDDAESCCDENEEETESCKRRRKTSMVCRSCNSRNSSVLFLPCRHLCCCTSCEAFLYACPVCNSPKKGTIEALIS